MWQAQRNHVARTLLPHPSFPFGITLDASRGRRDDEPAGSSARARPPTRVVMITARDRIVWGRRQCGARRVSGAAADRAYRAILLLLPHCAFAGLSSSAFSMVVVVGSGRWRRVVGGDSCRVEDPSLPPLFFLSAQGLKY
jgi:hypothetical protein